METRKLFYLSLVLILVQVNLKVLAQSPLIIPDNQVKILTFDDVNDKILIIDPLIMGDSSKLIFDEKVKSAHLIIKNAQIGNNVQIIGKGVNNSNLTAENGVSITKEAGRFVKATPGENGKKGKAGGNGKDLILEFEIETIKNILIDVSGGDGGNGGNGGNGGLGHEPDCSKHQNAGSGGHGGNGGSGGDGGNGGNIKLRACLKIKSL